MSDNTKIYKKMYEEEKSSPEVSIAELCRKNNVKYVNYNNWKKRYAYLQGATNQEASSKIHPEHTGSFRLPKSSRGPIRPNRPADSVTVTIPLKDLIESFKNGKRTIVVNTDKFINTLPQKERCLVLQELGKLMMEDRLTEELSFPNGGADKDFGPDGGSDS